MGTGGTSRRRGDDATARNERGGGRPVRRFLRGGTKLAAVGLFSALALGVMTRVGERNSGDMAYAAPPKSSLIGGRGSVPAAGATVYMTAFDVGSADTETRMMQNLGAAGTLSHFYVRVDDAPSAGDYTFTVRRHQTNTGVTCKISTAATSCSDITNSAPFAEGDTLSISIAAASGSAGPTIIRWNARYP